MKRTFVVRLFPLMFILVFSVVIASPSHAFPMCPSEPCGYYYSMCQEMGGTFNYYQYSGWCQDENFYLRGHGQVSCTVYGMTYEFGECADW
jgi:hypothetical protein